MCHSVLVSWCVIQCKCHSVSFSVSVMVRHLVLVSQCVIQCYCHSVSISVRCIYCVTSVSVGRSFDVMRRGNVWKATSEQSESS